jgi:hypothetical protein
MSDQSSSARRFTVLVLPVLPIVGQSLLLPFRFLPELVKFGSIPFLLILGADAICFILEREDLPRITTGAIMAIAHFILFTPFSVAWTRLAIRGRAAVANEPAFAYSRDAWIYLFATAVLIVVMLICCGFPFSLLRYGQRNFDNQLATVGGLGLLTGLFVFLIAFIRLAFVFPAIAIGNYQGLSAAWRQTAGNFERLAAIILLTYVPFWAVRQVAEWFIGYHPPGLASVARGVLDMLLIAMTTTAIAGPALAYKTLVLDESSTTTTAP